MHETHTLDCESDSELQELVGLTGWPEKDFDDVDVIPAATSGFVTSA